MFFSFQGHLQIGREAEQQQQQGETGAAAQREPDPRQAEAQGTQGGDTQGRDQAPGHQARQVGR